MQIDFTAAIIHPSWFTALLCLMMAGGIGYFYYMGWRSWSGIFRIVAWLLFGLCFIGTQFAQPLGVDWFISNQRTFFRMATNLVIAGELWGLIQGYLLLKPIIEASNNGK